MKFTIEKIYNQQGELLNRTYSADTYWQEYHQLYPTMIKWVSFIDETGKEFAFFYYEDVCRNVMADNPNCWYIDKKNRKITQYFDLLEQEQYHYEEVKSNEID